MIACFFLSKVCIVYVKDHYSINLIDPTNSPFTIYSFEHHALLNGSVLATVFAAPLSALTSIVV